MRKRLGLALFAALAPLVTAHAQPVVGDVSAVGFRATATNGPPYLIRAGQWAPIQARLTVQGSQLFQGTLRVESSDLDGDRVAFLESPVTVTPDAGLKRVWCYAVFMRDPYTSGQPATLDILSSDGVLINRLPVPQFDLIGNDALLLLDISAKPLTELRRLQVGSDPSDRGFGHRPYSRNVVIASMPNELPDRWFGLEAVDVLVWDEPNPTAVSIAQLQALAQWVRNGGQLVVGLGQSWAQVEKSQLVEILPFQRPPTAGAEQPATFEVRSLPRFFEMLVDRSRKAPDQPVVREFSSAITVANVQTRPGARCTFSALGSGHQVDLIAIQFEGSGRVIASAASLRELTQVPVGIAFWSQFVELTPLNDAFLKNEANSLQLAVAANSIRPYDGVVAPISFAGGASLLVLAAFAFVVAYIGVATFASWWWLKRHQRTALSWTVFAVLAVVASVLSLGTVSVSRGISRGVHAFSFIDLEGGAHVARAHCYFGYSSPMRQRVDFSLPGEGDFLRALARGQSQTASYATPERYNARPGQAVLEGTLMRATLKQFEGFWQGELKGTIYADLVADRQSGEILPTSSIQNNLDCDLTDGYLLYLDPRLSDASLASGKMKRYWGDYDVPPAVNVLAVRLPRIAAGQRLTGIGQDQYQAVRAAQRNWMATHPEPKPEERPGKEDLWSLLRFQHEQWAEAGLLQSLDGTTRDALLASTRTFYLHCDPKDFEKARNRPIALDGLMNCDISHWLVQGRMKAPTRQPDLLLGQAVLLLLADDPGPARLHGNGRSLGPLSGRSIYRVRVPLGFQGNPPAPGE